MVVVDMSGFVAPTDSNIGSAFFNLLEEMVKNSKEWNTGKKDYRILLQEWAKKRYNYNVEYIIDDAGSLDKVQIDTDEIFFVLKHG
jgi:hypothetical protein